MTSAQQMSALAGANCEVAFDNLTRQLYATDASLYQVEPVAVAFPKNSRQASALILAAGQAGIPVIPRGAGTGLVGGAIGEGLVIDFSRYNRQITEFDPERRSVRVGPGVVLDQLNAFLRPNGFCFGPDVATSSRATLGGMIANNSSGARTPAYGTTADHIRELEIVMADGRLVMVGAGHDTLRKQRELVEDLVYFNSLEIQDRLGEPLLKRRPGYAIHRCAQDPNNLNHLLCGSEGTLAAITSAELNIVPLPEQRGLAILFFASVTEAMQATVELLDLKPAAIEHVDRVLLDQTRGQREFQRARDLLDLEHRPCQSLLIVEFIEDVEPRLRAALRKKLGLRSLAIKSTVDAGLVWALRKAGLSILTSRPGDAKPVTGIEDVAVPPRKLPAYVAALQKVMGGLKLEASFYGHAASGLLHVRPVLDLRSPDDLGKFRKVAEEVAAIARQFKGSLAAEHGVGMARTEFMTEHLGEGLMAVMRQIKSAFDPHNVFNPGKIIPDGDFKIDSHLRLGPGYALQLPFTPVLAFSERDHSFGANLDQCNGCGGCRKETASMCPTFLVTGQEVMSTRGRANAIRAALDLRGLASPDALGSQELAAVLKSCLSCRACTTECPSSVNLPLLKAELLHAKIQRDGFTWANRVFSSVDVLGAIGCAFPELTNLVADSLVARSVLSKVMGISWQRPFPPYAKQRFDRWFKKRSNSAAHNGHAPGAVANPGRSHRNRGRVILWDDTFVRYHDPHIGIAAVMVLEAAGFEVALAEGRKCCGRPAFSQGDLDRAAKLGRHNVALLNRDVDNAPIVFLEPSCYSMFLEDYRELKIDGADRVAARCFLFEQFIEHLLSNEPGALKFKARAGKMVIHPHCHLKSLMDPEFLLHLANRLPEREVTLLDSGCCGMAGGFGMLEENYELSLKVAEPLMHQITGQPFGTTVVASGTSCRHQIGHLAPVRPRHMAEVLAEAIQGE